MADNYPPVPPPPGDVPPPILPPQGPPPEAPLPWEQPGYPVLEALFETVKLFMTAPSEAFRRMSLVIDLSKPIIYAVVLGWVAVIVSQLYGLVLPNPFSSIFKAMGNRDLASQFAAAQAGRGMLVVGMMILAPIFILIWAFVLSAIVHLFLMLVGGANAGFGTTLRVICYSSTAQLVQVVPFCGGFIAFVWAIVLDVVGLATAHKTTQGKALVAVLAPIVICCVCIVIVAVAFGAAIMAAIGRH